LAKAVNKLGEGRKALIKLSRKGKMDDLLQTTVGTRLTRSPEASSPENDGGRRRRKSQHQQAANHSLTRVLVGISVLFIVCQSLKAIPDVYEMLFCSDGEEDTY